MAECESCGARIQRPAPYRTCCVACKAIRAKRWRARQNVLLMGCWRATGVGLFHAFFGGQDPFQAFFGGQDSLQSFFGRPDPFQRAFALQEHVAAVDGYEVAERVFAEYEHYAERCKGATVALGDVRMTLGARGHAAIGRDDGTFAAWESTR